MFIPIFVGGPPPAGKGREFESG